MDKADNTLMDDEMDDLNEDTTLEEEESVESEIESDDIEDTDDAVGEETEDEDVEEKISKTKAFSNRLNKERETLRNQIEAEALKKLDAIAKSRNFESWSELEEYDEKEKISNMGIENPDEFKSYIDDLISKNPIVKEAQEVLNKQKQADLEDYVKSQMKEITKLDPSIKTLNDLVTLDHYSDFSNKLDKGYSLVDAYKVTYFNRITEKSKESALNNLEGKSHLKSTSGKGSTSVRVPQDIIDTYRKNIPDMTDDEIRKHYSNFINAEK